MSFCLHPDSVTNTVHGSKYFVNNTRRLSRSALSIGVRVRVRLRARARVRVRVSVRFRARVRIRVGVRITRDRGRENLRTLFSRPSSQARAIGPHPRSENDT